MGFTSGAAFLPGGLGVRAGGCAGLRPASPPAMDDALAQGSPSAEPPHRPDPAPRVPGGVDVRVCKAKKPRNRRGVMRGGHRGVMVHCTCGGEGGMNPRGGGKGAGVGV